MVEAKASRPGLDEAACEAAEHTFEKMTRNQSKSKRGGYRPGAGRKLGSVNKVTADVRAAASQYSEEALQTLVQIATSGESESARVAAANSILDRAHGKPRQAVDVDGEVGLTVEIVQFGADQNPE